MRRVVMCPMVVRPMVVGAVLVFAVVMSGVVVPGVVVPGVVVPGVIVPGVIVPGVIGPMLVLSAVHVHVRLATVMGVMPSVMRLGAVFSHGCAVRGVVVQRVPVRGRLDDVLIGRLGGDELRFGPRGVS